MDELREKILKYRATHDMSQEALAKKCGLSKQTLNYIETGKQNPTALTKTKILLVIEKEE